MRTWAANIVSLSRLLLVIPWALLQCGGDTLALPLILVIVATDLVDGPLARHLATASKRGAFIDSGCDLVVALTAACVLALRDVRFLCLGGLIVASFAAWAIHSRGLGRLAYTRLGKFNGVVCYLLVILASARPWLPLVHLRFSAAFERGSLGFAALYLAASVAENLGGLLGVNRSAGGCRAEADS